MYVSMATALRRCMPIDNRRNRGDAMPFVAFNNVAMVELFYRQDNQRLENVIHFQLNTTPNTTNLGALAAAVANWWDADMQPIVNTAVTLVAVKATSLNAQNAPGVEYTLGLPIAGTASGTAAPNSVTAAIKLVTLNRGRSFRGRIFHVGMSVANISGNVLTSGYRANLLSAYNTLTLPASFGGAVLVVASRTENGQPRAVGVATPVTSISVNPTLDSQRRRLPERGL